MKKKLSLFITMISILLFTFSIILSSNASDGDTTSVTDLSYCKVKYYEDITNYRNNPETIEDYLFAGWFKEETCDASTYLKKSDPSGPAYAKYVPKDILGLKVQVTKKLWDDDTTNDNIGAIRFVTSVDSKDYSQVGFIINIGGADNYKANKYVYKKLYGEIGSENKTKVDTYVPSEMFHSESEFFKTYTVQNISELKYLTEFDVTPYWVTLDGTTVKGDMETVTVNQLRQWDYVFVDDSGEATVTDDKGNTSVNPGLGTRNYPYKTLEDALKAMDDNMTFQKNAGDKGIVEYYSAADTDGKVYILNTLTADSSFTWNSHKLDVSIQGDKADKAGVFDLSAISTLNIGDGVTFENMTLTLPTTVYAWGNRMKIAENVDVLNTTTTPVSIYGGGNGDDGDDTDDDSVESTDVTLLTGTYKTIFGGGNAAAVSKDTNLYIAGDVKVYNGTTAGDYQTYSITGGGNKGNVGGSTNVYIGGNVNAGLTYTSHGSLARLFGGSFNATVTGDTNVIVEGNALFTYIFGGGNGASSVVNGQSNVYFRGSAKAMSVYGGSRLGKNNAGTFVEMTGDTWVEQVFGGSETQSVKGNTNVQILGGTVKRRVYGGCYNEFTETDGSYTEGTWETAHYVSGNTNVTVGKDAELLLDYTVAKEVLFTSVNVKADDSLYAISRYKEPFTKEIGTFIFTDYNDGSKLESQIGYVDGLSAYGYGYKDNFSATAYHYLVKAYEGGDVYTDGDVLHIEPDANMAATVTIDNVEKHYTIDKSTYILSDITSPTEQHDVEIKFDPIIEKDVSGYDVRIGNSYYTTLEAAVNSVNTTDATTITLLDNIEMNTTLAITEGKNITITDDGNAREIIRGFEGVMFSVGTNATLSFNSTGTDANPKLTIDGDKNGRDPGTTCWAIVHLTKNAEASANVYEGVQFINNISGSDGGVIRAESNSGKVNIYGGLFEGNGTRDCGGVLRLSSGTTAVVKNAVFRDNHAAYTTNRTGQSGGAILMQNGASLTVENCTFQANTEKGTGTGGAGGAVSIENKTAEKAVFKNCTFENNQAAVGGAATVATGAWVSFEDCTFEDNTATKAADQTVTTHWGNDIRIADASNTTIISGKFVGEIFNYAASKITVKGVLEEGSDVTIDWCASDSSRVPADNVGIVFDDDASMNANAQYISLGDMMWSSYMLEYQDAKAMFVEVIKVTNETEFDAALTTISSSDNVTGIIRLDADITLTGNKTIPEGCNITITDDGNAREIIRGFVGVMFDVKKNATLSFKSTGTDANPKLTIDGKDMDPGTTSSPIILMNASVSTVNIYEGIKIVNNWSNNDGGVIRAQADSGQINIYGGLFEGNKTNNHGGVLRLNSGTIAVINNAVFRDNHAAYDETSKEQSGGAIRMNDGASLTVENCTFQANTGKGNGGLGGAVSINNTTAEKAVFRNCTFKENEATEGGAVTVASGAWVSFEDCTFTSNQAKKTGSGNASWGNDVRLGGAASEVHISGKMIVEIFARNKSTVHVDGNLTEGSNVVLNWSLDPLNGVELGRIPTTGVQFASEDIGNESQQYINLGVNMLGYNLVYSGSVGNLELKD